MRSPASSVESGMNISPCKMGHFQEQIHRYVNKLHRLQYRMTRVQAKVHRFQEKIHQFVYIIYRFQYKVHHFSTENHQLQYKVHQSLTEDHQLQYEIHQFSSENQRFQCKFHHFSSENQSFNAHRWLIQLFLLQQVPANRPRKQSQNTVKRGEIRRNITKIGGETPQKYGKMRQNEAKRRKIGAFPLSLSADFVFKMMEFCIKMMEFVFENALLSLVFQCMCFAAHSFLCLYLIFVLELMKFAFKMMKFAF